MKSWQLNTLDVEPHQPQILSSTGEARAIMLSLPAGERLQDHEVHERAFLVLVSGEVEVRTADGTTESGGAGLVVEFDPGERHEVLARSDARFLLLLTPWPGVGHPGAMTLEDKAGARERAAEHEAAPG